MFHVRNRTVPEGNSWQRLAYSWPLFFPVLWFSAGHQPLRIARQAPEFFWCGKILLLTFYARFLCKKQGNIKSPTRKGKKYIRKAGKVNA
jgi:hypothetical protein